MAGNIGKAITVGTIQNKRLFSPCELVFCSALILNIAYSVFYSIYISLHEYYTYILAVFVLLIIFNEKRLKYKKKVFLGIVMFILLCAMTIRVNHSGMGVLLQIIWPLSLIYMFNNCYFSKNYNVKVEAPTCGYQNKGEKGIFQHRFFEHTILSESELNNQIDYIHYNPVKHGLVKYVKDWKFSSFHNFVKKNYMNMIGAV